MHPKERRFAATRRDFLKRTGGAAFALSAAGLLEACSNSTTAGQQNTGSNGQLVGPGGLPLARANGSPVTLPRWEDPIASGLEPETGGDFTVFNYPYYIYGKLLKEFGQKYNVTVKVTPFDDI
ncbi:MAG: spermidine/putrescine transport system substrate-binding protein, partial [Gaiellales bacterium]|nr:spermidine/putrescine transport system substrate-binding protein [Gaiellales bacterium]